MRLSREVVSYFRIETRTPVLIVVAAAVCFDVDLAQSIQRYSLCNFQMPH